MDRPTGTYFINVDLDVKSSGDLSPLIRHLEPRTAMLHAEEHFACIELNEASGLSLEETLRGLVTLVEQLPPEARAVWDACETRAFDAGFQAGMPGEGAWSPAFRVSPETLARIAAVGGELVVTIYRPDGAEESGGAGVERTDFG